MVHGGRSNGWTPARNFARHMWVYRDSRQQWRPRWSFKYLKGSRFHAVHEVHPAIKSLYFENEEKLFRPAFGTTVGKEMGFHHYQNKDGVSTRRKRERQEGPEYSARSEVLPYVLDCLEWSHSGPHSGIGNPNVLGRRASAYVVAGASDLTSDAASGSREPKGRPGPGPNARNRTEGGSPVADKRGAAGGGAGGYQTLAQQAEEDPARKAAAAARSMSRIQHSLVPNHILNIMQGEDQAHTEALIGGGASDRFVHKQLYWKIYNLHRFYGTRELRKKDMAGGATGIFPYVDEKASLLKDFTLHEIMHTGQKHRPGIRRHPIWWERHRWKQHFHGYYLRRRRILRQEVVQRLAMAVSQDGGTVATPAA